MFTRFAMNTVFTYILLTCLYLIKMALYFFWKFVWLKRHVAVTEAWDQWFAYGICSQTLSDINIKHFNLSWLSIFARHPSYIFHFTPSQSEGVLMSLYVYLWYVTQLWGLCAVRIVYNGNDAEISSSYFRHFPKQILYVAWWTMARFV